MSDPAASLVSEEINDAVAAGRSARLAAIREAEERLITGTLRPVQPRGNAVADHRLRGNPAGELTIDETQSQQ